MWKLIVLNFSSMFFQSCKLSKWRHNKKYSWDNNGLCIYLYFLNLENIYSHKYNYFCELFCSKYISYDKINATWFHFFNLFFYLWWTKTSKLIWVGYALTQRYTLTIIELASYTCFGLGSINQKHHKRLWWPSKKSDIVLWNLAK